MLRKGGRMQHATVCPHSAHLWMHRGGRFKARNIQPLQCSANRSKKHKTPDELEGVDLQRGFSLEFVAFCNNLLSGLAEFHLPHIYSMVSSKTKSILSCSTWKADWSSKDSRPAKVNEEQWLYNAECADQHLSDLYGEQPPRCTLLLLALNEITCSSNQSLLSKEEMTSSLKRLLENLISTRMVDLKAFPKLAQNVSTADDDLRLSEDTVQVLRDDLKLFESHHAAN